MFFEKKMDILKNGFESLEADRRALEKARKQFEQDRLSISDSVRRVKNEEVAVMLFQGVTSLLSLKKQEHENRLNDKVCIHPLLGKL